MVNNYGSYEQYLDSLAPDNSEAAGNIPSPKKEERPWWEGVYIGESKYGLTPEELAAQNKPDIYWRDWQSQGWAAGRNNIWSWEEWDEANAQNLPHPGYLYSFSGIPFSAPTATPGANERWEQAIADAAKSLGMDESQASLFRTELRTQAALIEHYRGVVAQKPPEEWTDLDKLAYKTMAGKRQYGVPPYSYDTRFKPPEEDKEKYVPQWDMERFQSIATILGNVYPDKSTEDIFASAQENPHGLLDDIYNYADQNPDEFIDSIRSSGRNQETEEFVRGLFPAITDEEVNDLFGYQVFTGYSGLTFEQQAYTDTQTRNYIRDAWQGVKAEPYSPGKQAELGLALVGAAGQLMEKYIGRPWEAAVLEMRGRTLPVNRGETFVGNQVLPEDREAIARLDNAYAKYGWTAIFSDEVAEAWEARKEAASETGRKAMNVLEWTNPVYMIPIGGSFGMAAKFTSKIPVLGKAMKYVAAGVMAAERGAAYPLTKPLELAGKGIQKTGERLGEKAANQIVENSGHALLEIPVSDKLLEGVLIDNWQRRAIERVSKLKPIEKVTQWTLGKRVLVDKSSQLVQDVVGRGAVLYTEVTRMGVNARNAVMQQLRAIEMNPVGYFGFNESGFSEKMAGKLLPEYKGEVNAGTLEHVITKPEMYDWTGLDKGLEYVTRVNDINNSMLSLLKAEGVPPENIMEDWIHRVVTGKVDVGGVETAVKGVPGKTGKAVGKKPAYEKSRVFKTMAEGIAEGYKYDPNIETSIGTYIEEGFKKIGSERFIQYTKEFGETPAERLAERFPEIVQRAELTKEELADAAKLHGAVNRAIRGEKLPSQTLTALEKRFPEIGKRLRSIIEEKPMKPIDEAAYLSEYGQKELFDYPVPQTVAPKAIRTTAAEDIRATYNIIKPKLSETNIDETIIDDLLKNVYKISPDIDEVGGAATFQRILSGGLTEQTLKENLIRSSGRRIAAKELGVKLIDLDMALELGPKANIAKEVVNKSMAEASKFHESLISNLPKRKEITSYIKSTRPPSPQAAEQAPKAIDRKVALEQIRKEAKSLVEGRKAPYWQARSEKAAKMEIVRQPGMEEGYLMQPFAGGKIYDQEFIDSFNTFLGHDPGLKALQITSDAAGIMRITKAALDFSAHAIQGLPPWGLAHTYMLTNQKMGARMMGAWYEGFGLSVAGFFRPEIIAKTLAKKEAVALHRISFGGSSKAADIIALNQGSGIVEKILTGDIKTQPFKTILAPLRALKPFQRAESVFYFAGEYVRDTYWEIMSKNALNKGEGHELARFLDRITGLTEASTLGVPATMRQFESSFAWFAPNYTRACLTVIADLFRGGMTGAEARKAIGGMIAAGGVYYSGTQFAISSMNGKEPEEAWQDVMKGFGVERDPITGELEWKPSASFMSIQVDNYNFGIGGFWYGLMRLGGNIASCIKEVGDKERIDLVKIMEQGKLNRDNPFIYWWMTRSSPLRSTISELINQQDFLGYPIETPEDYARYIITRFEPIWMEQGLNWMIPGMARDNEIPQGMLSKALVPLGEVFGARIFPDSSWNKFYDKADTYIPNLTDEDFTAFNNPNATPDDIKAYQAWKEDKLNWGNLTMPQKITLLSQYPELNDTYTEAQADSTIRNSGVWKQWDGVTQAAKDTYYSRGNELIERVRSGELNTKDMRASFSEAGQNYGITQEAIANDPHYKAIYERFEKLEEKGDKYDFTINMAINEYQSVVFTDYLDENGDIDWELRDEAIDEYIEKWGDKTYTAIRDMYADKKALEGLDPALVKMAKDKDELSREYWRLPTTTLKNMDEEEVPEEHRAIWNYYTSLPENEKEEYLDTHTILTKDFREEYRAGHPNEDAILAFWGYGGRLQTEEAYNIVEGWCKEYNIPIGQLGLGLPQRSLVPQYFEYQNIVREYGGSSIEAKLFRAHNPKWDAWGSQTYGWKSLDTSKLPPSIEVYNLYQEYQKLPLGQAKLNFRANHEELELWLQEAFGYSPIRDRGIKLEEFPKGTKEQLEKEATVKKTEYELPEKKYKGMNPTYKTYEKVYREVGKMTREQYNERIESFKEDNKVGTHGYGKLTLEDGTVINAEYYEITTPEMNMIYYYRDADTGEVGSVALERTGKIEDLPEPSKVWRPNSEEIPFYGEGEKPRRID